MDKPVVNPEVTAFLDEMNHPLREVIETLRRIILSTDLRLTEGIKWNGPNYSLNGEDRITLKINPPTKIQVIFHCGAKVKEQPAERLLKDDYSLLDWKSNDRAVLTLRNMRELEHNEAVIVDIVTKWLAAAAD